MLIVLRMVFGLAAAWFVREAWLNAEANPVTGDLANARILAIVLVLAIANAVVWAPFFGALFSQPITAVLTDSTYVDRQNYLLRLVVWLDARGRRRAARIAAFLEGIHHPERPTAFVIGLRNARPGSWLERVYAAALWRFDNLQHCTQAYRVLRRHGIDPRPHRNPEVNLALHAHERPPAADQPPLPLPPSVPQPTPQRNRRIRLFEGADAARRSEAITPSAGSDGTTGSPPEAPA